MKKVIITIAVASFISLGFALIENTESHFDMIKSDTIINNDFQQQDTSDQEVDKRLASWD